jgi:hypothetical protein
MSERPLCGAKKKPQQGGGTCKAGAGKGTDHPGVGRCKHHGGRTPIKHGRYSDVARARLGPALAAIEADPDPLNLMPELHLLRGLAQYHLATYGATPVSADLLERVIRAVDAIQKHKAKSAVTLETLNRVVEQMGVAVARHVKDPAVLAAIERDWGTLSLG